MRELIAGGGLVDLLTLHPLDALIALAGAVLVLRIALRRVALGRRSRPHRPSRAL